MDQEFVAVEILSGNSGSPAELKEALIDDDDEDPDKCNSKCVLGGICILFIFSLIAVAIVGLMRATNSL